MRFLVDAQLPPALARWLIEKGHLAEHVFERLGGDSSDTFLAGISATTGSIVISKDVDFLALQKNGEPQVICVKIGNSTNRILLETFERDWSRIVDALQRGDPVVEVG